MRLVFKNKNNGFVSMQRFLHGVVYASFSLFFVLFIATLIPVYNTVDKAEAAVGTSTESKITFTSTRSTASVGLTVGDKDGTFATSASNEKAAFSISTNNYTGYTLTLKSSSNTTALSNANGTINTLLSSTTYSTFSADTSEGKALNNRWGYIPNYYNATGTSPVENTTNYYPAPTTTQNIATLRTTSSANSANGEDNPDNYTIGLGLRADFTNPTGTYTNDALILELVANPVAYSITYADNTNDSSVSGIPAVQSGSTTGTGASSTEAESITLSNATPTRTGYTFSGWCLGTVSNNGTTCGGTTYAKSASFGIDKTNSNNATLYAVWTPNQYTCTKRYKLQKADGTFPNEYTTDTEASEQVAYGSTCTYTKSVADYKGSAAGANDFSATTSATMNSTDGIVLSLELYRNTYSLSVSAGANTSSPSGGGTKRWGETVTVNVTKASNVTCTSYAAPSWSQGNATGTIGSTSNTGNVYYMSYTMPNSDATVTATSNASDINQSITLSRAGGASGITIDGVNYTGSSASVTCGSHTISGSYDTHYQFYGWSRANNVTVSNANLATTTMNVTGAGSLTLTGQRIIYCTSSNSNCMQYYSFSSCTTSGATLMDARDGNTYGVKKIGNLCWMTDNLRIMGVVQAAYSNFSGSDVNISVGSPADGGSYTITQSILSTNSSYPGGYYNYCAASAGTICGETNSVNGSSDICPAGWHIPTLTEMQTIAPEACNTVTTAFNPIYNGYYMGKNGTLRSQGQGIGAWWTSTRYDDLKMRYMAYVSGGPCMTSGGALNMERYSAPGIRCVKAS